MKRILIPVLLMLFFVSIMSCKKSDTATTKSEAFFKTFNTTDLTPWSPAPALCSDNAGNIYCQYYQYYNGANSTIKTDKYGNTLWDKLDSPYVQLLFSGQYLYGITSNHVRVMDTSNKTISLVPLSNFYPAPYVASSIATVFRTNDGNFIISGYLSTRKNGILIGDHDFLAKISPDGKKIWETYDQIAGLINNIRETKDGNFILYMESDSTSNTGNYNLRRTKYYCVNAAGQILWQKIISNGSTGNLIGSSAYYTPYYLSSPQSGSLYSQLTSGLPAGGFIVAFQKYYSSYFSRQVESSIELYHYDDSLNVLDSLEIQYGYALTPVQLIKKTDGNLLLIATSSEYIIAGTQSVIVDISPDLAVNKITRIGNPTQSYNIGSVISAGNDYYVFAGVILTSNKTNNLFILKTDGNGRY